MRTVLLAAALVATAVGVTPATAATPRPPASCAIGTLPGAEGPAVRAAFATAQRRYDLRHPGAGARERAAFGTGLAAYVYGFPRVSLQATVTRYPANQLIGIAQLTTPATRAVVAPNHDTLYSVARLDLTGAPVFLDLPATGGRYAVLQLLDQFTNSFAYLTGGSSAQTAMVVGPGSTARPPAGVRLIRSPSKLVWLLGRTLVDIASDVPAATALMSATHLTPSGEWLAGGRAAPIILPAFPPTPAAGARALPQHLAFFEALFTQLRADPPPARDACALRAFATAGLDPARPRLTKLDPARARALRAAADAGPALVEQLAAGLTAAARGGWTQAGPEVGNYNTTYSARAAVATIGLGANTREQAIYPVATTDERGRMLDGRHIYTLRFAPGRQPPVNAFWSLTLYGPDRFFAENPLHRYALGDRSPGLLRAPDGSLTITVSHRPPPVMQRGNWLPAPTGRFSLYLRLYLPRAAAVTGKWQPPAIRRTR